MPLKKEKMATSTCYLPPDMAALQTKNMEKMKINEGYELFARLMEDEKVYMNPFLTFDSVCALIGVGHRELDDYIRGQLGCGGHDIMKAYRDSLPLYFLQKYGIMLCFSIDFAVLFH